MKNQALLQVVKDDGLSDKLSEDGLPEPTGLEIVDPGLWMAASDERRWSKVKTIEKALWRLISRFISTSFVHAEQKATVRLRSTSSRDSSSHEVANRRHN